MYFQNYRFSFVLFLYTTYLPIQCNVKARLPMPVIPILYTCYKNNNPLINCLTMTKIIKYSKQNPTMCKIFEELKNNVLQFQFIIILSLVYFLYMKTE